MAVRLRSSLYSRFWIANKCSSLFLHAERALQT